MEVELETVQEETEKEATGEVMISLIVLIGEAVAAVVLMGIIIEDIFPSSSSQTLLLAYDGCLLKKIVIIDYHDYD